MAIRVRLTQLVILLMIALAAIGRLTAFGDPRLAVATNDTISYVTASEAQLLSRDFFSGERLPTTILLYKIFKPPEGYVDFVVPNTTERQILAGYDNIALLQVILSILGWGTLAFVISSKVNNLFLKFVSCGLTLLLGIVPQTSDWDSVMGSESLSFSLFTLVFAFLISFVFRIHEDRIQGFGTPLVGAAFCVTFMFWANTRDSNNLSSIITAAMFCSLLFIEKFRNLKLIRSLTIFLCLVTLVGVVSSLRSTRSATPMRNVFDVHILPFAARIEFMQGLGMPEPFSQEYFEWADTHSSRAYLAFLLTHPRYTATRYMDGAQDAFSDYIQPYFRTPNNEWRLRLMPVGQVINVGFVAFIVDIILIVTFWILAYQGGFKPAEPWIWLATWLFLTAASTLFFGVIGDNIGLNRHTLFPIAAFRLFFWTFLIVALDLLLTKRFETVPPSWGVPKVKVI